MNLQTRRLLHPVLIISCALSLTLLLSACDLFGSSTPAKPTPTPAPPTMTTYTGTGFSLSYPQGLTPKEDDKQLASLNGKLVTFSDTAGITQFTVGVVPNPGGIAPTKTGTLVALDTFKKEVKNYKDAQIAPSATVAGDTWDQSAATGDITAAGTTANAKLIVLADNHPAHTDTTKLFVIYYGTATQLFDLQNTTTFQPMLQSFKFL